eukprot:1797675-Pyramimonas_sp.AAC.1
MKPDEAGVNIIIRDRTGMAQLSTTDLPASMLKATSSKESHPYVASPFRTPHSVRPERIWRWDCPNLRI